MCFNEESSLIAFIIPTLFCIRLLMFKNDNLKNISIPKGISIESIDLSFLN